VRPPVVGLREAAAVLFVDPDTLRYCAYNGTALARRLGVFKVGRDWLVERELLQLEVARREGREAVFFDPAEDDEPVGPRAIAALMVLHAEAHHGCGHTEPFREALGLCGPREEPSEEGSHP